MDASDEVGVPEGVELTAAVVENTGQPGVKAWRCVAEPIVQTLLFYTAHTHTHTHTM